MERLEMPNMKKTLSTFLTQQQNTQVDRVSRNTFALITSFLNNAFFNCLGYVASNDRVICEK
jgi:hypothetical protein